MDVNYRQRAGWTAVAWVATAALVAATRAEEAVYASDQDAPASTLVIADDGDTSQGEAYAVSASDADPFVLVASDEPARLPAPAAKPPAATAAADVAVVPAISAAEPLRASRPAFIRDGYVALAGANEPIAQPLRQQTTLQVRSTSSGRSLADRMNIAAREQPGDVQVAVHREARRGGAPKKQAQPRTAPLEQQLIAAHQLSQRADSEGEYSRIIQLCSAPASELGDAEQRKFAVQLAAWALNRRGEARFDEGQSELAMADYHASLELDPTHWRTLHNRSVAYAQEGRFAEAFDDVSRVIELNPDFAKAYANRATLYVQAGDLAAAHADYTAAIERDGSLVVALAERGRVEHLLGQLERAEADLSAAIAAGGADVSLYCSRGDVRTDLGRYADAMADYAEAIDRDQQCFHAYRNGAWLLATCPDPSFRDPENAIFGARQALECGYGERHSGLDTLAAALASAGKFEEAIATEQQAIDVAPGENRAEYEARLQLYEAREPYRTAPVR